MKPTPDDPGPRQMDLWEFPNKPSGDPFRPFFQEPEDLFTIAIEKGGTDAGYIRIQNERKAAIRAFETKWGVPIGRRVRVQLSIFPRPLEGVIRLSKESNNQPQELLLTLNGITFHPHQIESAVTI